MRMSKEQLTNKNNIVFYSQSASWQYYVFLFLFTIFCPLLFFSCSLEGDMNEQRKKGNISNPSIAAPGLPIVNPADSLLTVNWTAVEEAEIYEVFISTSQNPPSKSQKTVSSTTTVLDGLMNKTVYYVWIKAKNEIHSSDFSPRGRGIPWPVNEIPAVPERPIIIQGVNQLTVNWEKSGGAVFYEVYINTSTSRPSAPEITTDKTSAIINNLNNNTIYYLWVRAVNSAGKSNYSPLEAGTPKIPTVAPTAPAKPVLNAGSRSLTASWDAVEYASAYEVWTGTTNDSGKAQKWGSDISGGVTETVISGLTNDTTYYVWIKAKNLVGTSGFSPSANARSSAYAVEPVTPGMPAVIPGFGSLEINWQETEGALSYELWTGITNNTESAKKHGADIQGKSITLTGLVNETTYYIWIKAKNNTGASGFSPMASGTPSAFAITPSSPQTAPTVIEGNGQLSINWQPVNGATVYEVWAGISNNYETATKRGNDVSGLSAVINGLTNGTTYYFWIKAKNSVGTSGFSPAASGTPQVNAVPPQAPAAPAVSIGNSQIIITWAAVQTADSYEIWFATDNNSGSASKYGSDISASLSATISGLNNGTVYYIWVRAKNYHGSSGFSPVASGKPIANTIPPSLVAANEQIIVNWSVIAGADQYEVFCGTGINPPQTASLTVNAPSTTATITGLVNGTNYNVWIRGKNSTGTSTISSPASAKPLGNMGTVSVSAGNQQLAASWTSVAGADQYEVYHSTSSTMPGSPSQTVSAVTATISGLTNGTMYNVWVKAKNANGTSYASTIVNGKPLGTPGTPTLTPGFRQLSVSWSTVTGADEYEVYYGIGTATTLATTVTGTSAIITELINGTTYHVRLRARNASGVSGFSPTTSGTPNNAHGTGFYRNGNKVGEHNLNMALSYISTNAVNNDEFIIILGEDESILPATLGYSGKTVGITLQGYIVERTITLSSNGTLFTVNAGVTLTREENISLVGKSSSNGYLVSNTSTLIMNDGAMISGNNVNRGVYNYGTFTMYGGTISGNTTAGYGAGIYNLSTFTMYGGTISGNTAYELGGGVHNGSDRSLFTMYGGIISGNTARYGAGINASLGNFKKDSFGSDQGGIIYGSDAIGNDADGIPLGNTASYNNWGHAVYDSTQKRNTTAWETDHIDTKTGRGLSASGEPPFRQ